MEDRFAKKLEDATINTTTPISSPSGHSAAFCRHLNSQATACSTALAAILTKLQVQQDHFWHPEAGCPPSSQHPSFCCS
ncbi:MAG: hypothetical protein SGPRY_002220 [Prymnesium sp.]